MTRPRLYPVTALVLRQHDLGESDRILTLLTRERGKLRAVAKGVRRARSKLASCAQSLCCSNMQLAAGANLDVVTQCQVRNAFYGLRADLRRLSFASYFADLVDCFVEDRGGGEQVFDLLYAAVARAERGDRLELLARVFELRLLKALGYAPELGACLRCGAELDSDWVGFSPAMGGVICRDCAKTEQGWQRLCAGALRSARICQKASPTLLPRIALTPAVSADLDRAMRAHIQYYLGRHLRAGTFLDGLPKLLGAALRPRDHAHADD